MILRDRYDGTDDPFEGDRELLLRRLPADARIVRARATVTPASPPGSHEPFVETLAFDGNLGDWGATKSIAPGWVEVDFHARRTAVGLSGQLGAAVPPPATVVQVDLGGGFVPIGDQGTFLVPPQSPLTVSGASAVLPTLTATRLRLFRAGAALDLTSVRVRSAPAGVRLGLPGQPSFWFHAGELTRPETTPDFADLLQVYLDEGAEVADGVVLLPFVLHSDVIARLRVGVEIEYLRRTGVLADGVSEAPLSFDFGGLPGTPGVLMAALPGDARVAGGAGRVSGAFAATRIAFGPTGTVASRGELSVAPDASPAQPLRLPAAAEAVAVDLLLAAATRTARLQLDLRQDLNGKPAGESFLPAPVVFDLDREMAGGPTWVSVPLPAPYQFRAGAGQTYWLVLQALDGEATWSVDGTAPALPPMQLSRDGGFSWRQATLAAAPAAPAGLAGFLRLRSLPPTFRMPVELRVGAGEGESRVSLARFAPLGKVDLPLDFPELAAAFNQALEAAPDRCPEAEHLVNGGFEEWTRTGNELGSATLLELQGRDDIPLVGGRVAATADGRMALVASWRDDDEVALRIVDLDREEVVGTVRVDDGPGPVAGLAVGPGAGRAWVAFADPAGRIWILDPQARRALAAPLALLPLDPATGQGGGAVRALALDPEGETLYAVLAGPAGGRSPSGRMVALDTRRLEEAALRGDSDARSAVTAGPTTLSLLDPVDLAVAPDGAWIYLLVAATGPDDSSGAQVLPVEAQGLRPRFDLALDLGGSPPRALTLAPDGRLAVLLDDRLVLTAATAGAASVSVPLAAVHDTVAVDVDGTRAFAVGPSGLTVVDLVRRVAAGSPRRGDSIADVALAPGGDRVLALVPSTSSLESIPVGAPLPVAWTLTAGRVARWTRHGLGPAAFLGDLAEARVTNNRTAVEPATAAISQVVPVAAECTYELAFRGLASERDAVAEVVWRTGSCGKARIDTVPVTPVDDRSSTRNATPALAFHRARFRAPAGAAQAEVRFRAPAGVAVLIDDASFRATPASVVNGGFEGAGLPEPWRLEPAAAPGLRLGARGDGLRLHNAGTGEAAVVQEVALGEARAYHLEVRGRSAPGPARRVARVEVRWLGEGSAEAAPASSWTLATAGFEGFSARGEAPAGSLRAQVRLVVPAGVAVDVERVDLRLAEPTRVPVTFVSEAPGELAVVGWELTYDQVPGARPPIPETGLCPPEPPPLVAGEAGSDGDDCRHDRGKAAAPVAVPVPESVRRGSAVTAVPVAEIRGIGRARTRQLREVGLDSIEALAAATPASLMQVLDRISEQTATEVILQAREKLRSTTR